MRNVVMTELADEYEINQLVPVETKEKTESSQNGIEDAVEKLPEATALVARMAAMEAIVDTIIEDTIEEAEEKGETVTSQDLEEVVAPTVDTAVQLRHIPSSMKKRIPTIIARHLKVRNPQYSLVAKTAKYVANYMTDVSEETAIKVADETPEAPMEAVETGAPINPTVDGSVDSEVEQREPIAEPIELVNEEEIKVTVPDVKEEVANAMKFYVASNINQRKATALLSKKFTGAVLQHTLMTVRNCLPENFKKKYGVR
jgi:hypothetical protein